MSKENNLTDFLTEIASTIRANEGSPAGTKINPQDFNGHIRKQASFNSPIASFDSSNGKVAILIGLKQKGFQKTNISFQGNNALTVNGLSIKNLQNSWLTLEPIEDTLHSLYKIKGTFEIPAEEGGYYSGQSKITVNKQIPSTYFLPADCDYTELNLGKIKLTQKVNSKGYIFSTSYEEIRTIPKNQWKTAPAISSLTYDIDTNEITASYTLPAGFYNNQTTPGASQTVTKKQTNVFPMPSAEPASTISIDYSTNPIEITATTEIKNGLYKADKKVEATKEITPIVLGKPTLIIPTQIGHVLQIKKPSHFEGFVLKQENDEYENTNIYRRAIPGSPTMTPSGATVSGTISLAEGYYSGGNIECRGEVNTASFASPVPSFDFAKGKVYITQHLDQAGYVNSATSSIYAQSITSNYWKPLPAFTDGDVVFNADNGFVEVSYSAEPNYYSGTTASTPTSQTIQYSRKLMDIIHPLQELSVILERTGNIVQGKINLTEGYYPSDIELLSEKLTIPKAVIDTTASTIEIDEQDHEMRSRVVISEDGYITGSIGHSTALEEATPYVSGLTVSTDGTQMEYSGGVDQKGYTYSNPIKNTKYIPIVNLPKPTLHYTAVSKQFSVGQQYSKGYLNKEGNKSFSYTLTDLGIDESTLIAPDCEVNFSTGTITAYSQADYAGMLSTNAGTEAAKITLEPPDMANSSYEVREINNKFIMKLSATVNKGGFLCTNNNFSLSSIIPSGSIGTSSIEFNYTTNKLKIHTNAHTAGWITEKGATDVDSSIDIHSTPSSPTMSADGAIVSGTIVLEAGYYSAGSIKCSGEVSKTFLGKPTLWIPSQTNRVLQIKKPRHQEGFVLKQENDEYENTEVYTRVLPEFETISSGNVTTVTMELTHSGYYRRSDRQSISINTGGGSIPTCSLSFSGDTHSVTCTQYIGGHIQTTRHSTGGPQSEITNVIPGTYVYVQNYIPPRISEKEAYSVTKIQPGQSGWCFLKLNPVITSEEPISITF